MRYPVATADRKTIQKPLDHHVPGHEGQVKTKYAETFKGSIIDRAKASNDDEAPTSLH